MNSTVIFYLFILLATTPFLVLLFGCILWYHASWEQRIKAFAHFTYLNSLAPLGVSVFFLSFILIAIAQYYRLHLSIYYSLLVCSALGLSIGVFLFLCMISETLLLGYYRHFETPNPPSSPLGMPLRAYHWLYYTKEYAHWHLITYHEGVFVSSERAHLWSLFLLTLPTTLLDQNISRLHQNFQDIERLKQQHQHLDAQVIHKPYAAAKSHTKRL